MVGLMGICGIGGDIWVFRKRGGERDGVIGMGYREGIGKEQTRVVGER